MCRSATGLVNEARHMQQKQRRFCTYLPQISTPFAQVSTILDRKQQKVNFFFG